MHNMYPRPEGRGTFISDVTDFFFYGNQGHLPPSKYPDDDHGGGSDISNCNVHFGGPGGVWGAKGGMMVKQIKKKNIATLCTQQCPSHRLLHE